MYETSEELERLDTLLTTSLRGSGSHLRGIITEGERTLDAAEMCQVLTGMRTLTLATVTALGEPRISGVDGHLIHARWVFTTSGDAAKATHMRVRPAVSAAHVVGDDLGVYCHGRVEFLTPEHPDFAGIEEHLVGHYGGSPSEWGPEIVYCRVQPHWMVAYAFNRDEILAAAAR